MQSVSPSGRPWMAGGLARWNHGADNVFRRGNSLAQGKSEAGGDGSRHFSLIGGRFSGQEKTAS